MVSNEWKLPLNLAIGFHLLIALAVVYLPHLFTPTPRFEEIYTVNLINISDAPPSQGPKTTAESPPESAQPAPPPPKPIAKAAPPKKVVENAIALNEPEIIEPTPMVTPAAPEAISIKPAKRKIKAEVPPEPVQQKTAPDQSQIQRQKLAEKIRAEQKIAEVRQKAIEAERKAAEEARILAEEAELERRLAEATANRMKAAATRAAATSRTTGEGGRTSGQPTALEKQYYAAVMARIQAFWSLPEYKKWNPALKAIVVITVEKDGRIAGSFFESQSGDTTFDRFADKALQDVGYLPAIPAAIRKDRLEIGLNFTPGGIR